MKKSRFHFYVFLILLVAVNVFCVWAEHPYTVKNLNASSATVYFNIETNSVSAVDKPWTLSFNRTSIGIHSGVGIQVLNKSFDQILEAPQANYVNMLEKGGNSWYEYDMFSHSITPLPQKILVLKLASGKYVKMEIQNYYKDGSGDSGYYTFRYDYIK